MYKVGKHSASRATPAPPPPPSGDARALSAVVSSQKAMESEMDEQYQLIRTLQDKVEMLERRLDARENEETGLAGGEESDESDAQSGEF